MVNLEELDQEWVELILEALNSGITVDEIKVFFTQSCDLHDS
jgi:uncharacterized protein (DUF433 family)